MTVLVGVDESTYSKAVVEFVTKTTWPKETRFLVVSASPPVFMGPGEVAAPAAIEQVTQAQESFHKELADRAADALRKAGLQAEARMVPADPRTALVEGARKEGAGLIIVGSHGRTGLSKLFLGSVASHVVTHAHCNVLVIKQQA